VCPEVPAYYVAAKVQKSASVSGQTLAGQRFNGVMKIKQAPTQNEEYFLMIFCLHHSFINFNDMGTVSILL
jgi:hypothetical protein